LERAAALLARALPEAVPEQTRVSAVAFEFRPPPLFFDQPGEPIEVGACRTLPHVQCILHRFGAASFVYRIPLPATLDGLVPLSDALYDHPALKADAVRRAAALIETLRPALSRPGLAPLSEDYAVFHLRETSPPVSPDSLLADHALTLAQILRSEPRPLSPQEVADALESRSSLTPADLAIVDWNAALIIQADPDPALLQDQSPTPTDIRAVLEFANISLLELRFLDDRLDRALDLPIESVSRPIWGRRLRRPLGSELRRLSELQADAAALFDAVTNSYKMVGDPYLARLFRMAAHQLRLQEWDASIRNRLATAESIYSKITDFHTTRRMEILEWIIILLIAFEVVMAFVRD
jgi:hypothetical protein